MKDFRCMIGIHDWTQWRRPPVKAGTPSHLPGWPLDKPLPAITSTTLAGGTIYESQSRRCKRCGKTQSRPFPSSRKQAPGPE